jgi:hypothetical protein
MAKKRAKPAATQTLRSPERRFSIPERTTLYLCLGVFLILALLSFDPKPFLGGDNATYILLAKGLVQGKGFRDIWAPGMPPHTQYPFGLPLLLTPFVAVFPHSVIPMKFFVLALALVSFILVHAFFKDAFTEGQRLALMILLALSPALLQFSHWVLSEVPYLCVSFLGLFLLKDREASFKDWRFWLGLLAIAFAYHIRTAGIALVIALPLFLLLKRKWKASGIALIVLFLLLLPWTLRNRGLSEEGGYLRQFLLKDSYNPALGYAALSDIISRFGTNLKIYALGVVPGFVFPPLGDTTSGGILVLIGLLASALCLWGLFSQARQRLLLSHVYLVCYLGVALLWPSVWSDFRFLLSILPLILGVFLSGAFSLSGILWKLKPKAIGTLLVALSALTSLWVVLTGIPGQATNTMAYLRGDEFAGYPEPYVTFFQAADWVKANTEPNAVVISRKPTLFYLRAERPSFIYPFSPAPESLASAIEKNRADYIVVDQVSGTTQRYLIPALRPGIPDRYELVHQTPEPATYILRIKRP